MNLKNRNASVRIPEKKISNISGGIGKYIILWLLGVPASILILVWIVFNVFN